MSNVFDALLLLAADAPAKEGSANPWMSSLVLLAMVIGAFYISFVLPNKMERKKQDKLTGGLKKNDKVVTRGGIIGTVVTNAPDSYEIVLQIADSTRIKIVKSAIEHVITEKSEERKDGK